MKNLLFLYLTICLAIGILISEKLKLGANLRIYFILLFFTLFISQLIKNQYINSVSFCLQFIVIGILLHQATNKTTIDYYTKPIKNKVLILKVLENYNVTPKYLKFKVENITNKQIGILHIKPLNQSIYPSDTLMIFGNIYPLNLPLNPNQFDYKKFLNHKTISHSIYSTTVLKINSKHNSWQKLIINSKENIRIRLAKDGYTQEARAIISSMLLGDRTEITEEINKNYIAAGVIHILSISGLHVVIIYIILQFIFQPLLFLKNGRRIRIIISLIIIWMFSFYVELEPPVFRSALMITIYYSSELLKRPKNIYHTLSLSAFIILLFQPNYLFDVGFQLSYSAVFFIVWLNPIYSKLYQPKHIIPKYFYELSATSISAQLGTMPFSTLYFNQFSGLFLLGNIILVPASFLMILGAILAILFSFLRLPFTIYIKSFNWFIMISNQYLKWLATFDDVVFRQVYISGLTAVLILIILILIRPLIIQYSKLALLGILSCIIMIQMNRILNIHSIRSSKELIIFNTYKNSLLAIRNGQKAYFFTSENLDSTRTIEFVIRPYLIRNRIRKAYYYPIDTAFSCQDYIKTKDVLYLQNQSIFLGENLSNIPTKLDYLLIRNSSFNPQKLSNSHQIKRVIADGSNYPNYIIELEHLFKNNSDSILWKTSEKGYFLLRF